MVRYENIRVCIFMNFNENNRNLWNLKLVSAERGCCEKYLIKFWEKKNNFLVIALFFDILDIANAISRKV